jgi:hypothetical protein
MIFGIAHLPPPVPVKANLGDAPRSDADERATRECRHAVGPSWLTDRRATAPDGVEIGVAPNLPGRFRPGDRQFVGVDIHVGPESHLAGGDGELEGREATQQAGESGAHLDAGQLLAQALMDAVAEGPVTAGRAVDVQGVGVAESLRIAVGGQQRDNDGRPLRDCFAKQRCRSAPRNGSVKAGMPGISYGSWRMPMSWRELNRVSAMSWRASCSHLWCGQPTSAGYAQPYLAI